MNKQYRDIFNNWFKKEFKHIPNEDLNIAINESNTLINATDIIKTPIERLQEEIIKYNKYAMDKRK